MKTKLLFLTVIFAFAFEVNAQINTKVFILDLGIPNEKAIKISNENDRKTKLVAFNNQPISFQLINGNPYKYRYSINHNLLTFFNSDENPLESVKSTLEKIEPKTQSDTTNPSIAENNLNSLLGRQAKIDVQIKDLKSSDNAMGAEGSSKFNLESKSMLNFLNFKSEELEKAIKVAELELDAAKSEYPFKSQYSIAFVNQKQQVVLKTPINEKEDEENIKKAINVLSKEFKNLKAKLDKYILQISAEDYLDKDKFKFESENYFLLYSQLINDTKEIGSEAYLFDNTKKEFDEKIKEIDPLSTKIIEEISKMMQVKFDNYIVPIDINGKNIDVVEITVQRFDKLSQNPKPDEYKYNIWINGGLKIDVSAGLFITSLLDKEYETKNDGANKFIYEKNNGNYDFGFGSMINLSLRGGSWIRPAFNVGALFTANQKFQILTGLGFIFGKEERLVLHAGLSMGQIKTINDNYKTDGSLSYDLGTEGTIPTTDKFSFGHFFGITYNFGKIKKTE